MAHRSTKPQLSVVVERRIATALDAIAQRKRISRAEAIRRAIADALARDERRQLAS